MPKLRTSLFTYTVLFDGEPEYGSNTECVPDQKARGKYTVRDWLATAGRRAILAAATDMRFGAGQRRSIALPQHIESTQGFEISRVVFEVLAVRRGKR
jgi:hypothetical protein